MRVLVNKEKWEWFKEMQAEGRTRTISISSFPTSDPELNLEVEILVRDFTEEENKQLQKEIDSGFTW